MIDVYSAIEQHEKPAVHPGYTIDAVVARIERVVVRECEKGGTAASIKTAMDRVIDQVHNETRTARDATTGLVTRAVEKAREKLDPPPR